MWFLSAALAAPPYFAPSPHLSNVPRGTEVVVLHPETTYLGNLPASLRVLDASDTRVTYLGNLPAGLEVLDVSGTSVSYVGNLPAGLQVLDLSRTRVSYVGSLPRGLRVLDLRNTEVSYVGNLAAHTCVVSDRPLRGHAWVVPRRRFCDWGP